MRRRALALALVGLVGCQETPIETGATPLPSEPRALVAAAGAFTVTQVTAGAAHSCALTAVGDAYCWGDNSSGQLGDNSANPCYPNIICSTTPVLVVGGLTFKEISAGSYHTCGLTTAGAAYCWGENINGQLGTASPTTCTVGTPCSRAPVAVAGGLTFARIASGSRYTCAITTAGNAYCWGYNVFGMLGDGSTTDRAQPTPVAGALTFAMIGPGTFVTCGVTTTSQAYCWGQNNYGQLGATSPEQCVYFQPYPCSTTPLAVNAPSTTWRVADGGTSFSCGLTTSGAARCWGKGSAGQLGNGNYDDSPTPVVVVGGHAFQSLTVGDMHACAVTGAGVAYCWGLDMQGQLGVNKSTGTGNSAVPVAVHGGLTWAQLSAGDEHTCGATLGGAAYCWGKGHRGQIGNGTRFSYWVPTAVLPPSTVDQPPVAKLVVVGCTNLACTFNATLSTDDDGIAGYQWTFGDGTTASGAIVDHTFLANGTWSVNLAVSDSSGQVTTASTSVDVFWDATCGGLTCDFSAGSTSGNVTSYAWQFGDGTSGSGGTARHAYAAAGTYTAVLTLTDVSGAKKSSSRTVQPTPTAPNGSTGQLASNTGAGCLATTATTGNPAGTVSVATCAAGAAGQTWTVPNVGGAGVVKAVGACLTANGTASGATVGTAACVAAPASQQWTYTSLGELRSSAGLCVSKTSPGPTLRPCNGIYPEQRWTLKPSSPPPPTGLTGLLASNTGSGCIAAASGAVTIATCASGAASQTWNVPNVGATGTVTTGGACLTANGTSAGATLSTATCAGAAAQQWTYSTIGELRSAAGLCVSKTLGGPTLRACNGTYNEQRWTVK